MQKIKLGKKAIFFSIVSIMIIILFSTTTELVSKFRIDETELEVTRTRIEVLNSLVNDMENNYFEKIVYVSSKNAVIGLSKYYGEDYNRINKNLGKATTDVIQNGILHDLRGNSFNLSSYIKREFTLNSIKKNLNKKFNEFGMRINEFTVNITKDGITQIDPFTLRINTEIYYDFEEINHIVAWRGSLTKDVDITLIGVNAYDMPSNSKQHKSIVSKDWLVDSAPYTEPSLYNKLSFANPIQRPIDNGLGLCSPLFRHGGETCDNDV